MWLSVSEDEDMEEDVFNCKKLDDDCFINNNTAMEEDCALVPDKLRENELRLSTSMSR